MVSQLKLTVNLLQKVKKKLKWFPKTKEEIKKRRKQAVQKKSARVVEDNSPQEETDKAQAKSASSKQALADQAEAPQASQAETTTKEPASKTPVTITDPVQARQIIIDVMGLDAHALDGYTDEQILESVAAAEELGSDPGYSYRYLQEHFGK
ncbi:hypothetical protein [Aerococcus sanguinicola]|nr:hypothetical protein [Aerococcus sanguinicola]